MRKANIKHVAFSSDNLLLALCATHRQVDTSTQLAQSLIPRAQSSVRSTTSTIRARFGREGRPTISPSSSSFLGISRFLKDSSPSRGAGSSSSKCLYFALPSPPAVVLPSTDFDIHRD